MPKIVLVAGWVVSGAAVAQATNHYTEYVKTITTAKNIQAYDKNLFGDQINLYTGSTEFSVTDVSLAGNNALSVAIGRRFVVEDKLGYYGGPGAGSTSTQFGDWILDIPYLHGVFVRSTGWVSRYAPAGHRRCSIDINSPNAAKPPATSDAQTGQTWFGADEYWHGNFLHIPGSGDQEMMVVNAANLTKPTTAETYHWVTKEQWFFSCTQTTANGVPGEAFVALAPDGTKYWFNWFATFPVSQLEKPHGMPGFEVNALAAKEDQGSNVGLKKLDPASPDAAAMLQANFAFVRRHEVKIYPTQVQDRFGNKVIYTYDPAPGKARRLIKIEGFRPDNASDGRVIDIAYNDATGLITRVSAGARHWDYAYPNGALTTVTLPDQSTWRYSLGGLANAYIKAELSSPECWGPPMDPDQGTYSGSITHPSGATGTFSFKPTLHGRSNMPPDGQNCIWFSYWDGTDYQSTFVSVVPQLFAAVSIQDKQIAGPGLSGMQWHYDYSPAVNCSQGSCPGTKTVTVTSSGKRERHTFSNRFKDAEGMIEKLETGATGGGALSTQQHTYVTNASGQLFPDRVGISPFGRGDRSAERFAPVSMTQTTQDARVFTWQVAPGCDGATLCFDKFARPTSVIKSSAPAP